MEVISFFEKADIPKGSALCLGNFDGVHRGHRQLFDAAKKYGVWGVLVFEEGLKDEKSITTLSEKLDIIEKYGADYVIKVKPTEEFLSTDGRYFYELLTKEYKVKKLIAGYDFRFGKGAKCTSADLEKWCSEDSLSCHIESEYVLFGLPVKSKRIRELISSDDIADANELLGYRYFVLGRIEKGLGNGQKMGFPTANVVYEGEKLLPPDGVYMGTIEIDNEVRKAVINIGKNPTFDAKKRTVEVHIPGFDADIYGEKVRVEFIGKIRGEIKFDTVDELVSQIKKDVEKACS